MTHRTLQPSTPETGFPFFGLLVMIALSSLARCWFRVLSPDLSHTRPWWLASFTQTPGTLPC